MPYPRPIQHEFVQPARHRHLLHPSGLHFNLTFSVGRGPLRCFLTGCSTARVAPVSLALFEALAGAAEGFFIGEDFFLSSAFAGFFWLAVFPTFFLSTCDSLCACTSFFSFLWIFTFDRCCWSILYCQRCFGG